MKRKMVWHGDALNVMNERIGKATEKATEVKNKIKMGEVWSIVERISRNVCAATKQ